jgi:hypothetical protein
MPFVLLRWPSQGNVRAVRDEDGDAVDDGICTAAGGTNDAVLVKTKSLKADRAGKLLGPGGEGREICWCGIGRHV